MRGYFSLAADITDVKNAEQAVRLSEARLARILENAPIGMAIISPDLRFQMTNASLCTMLQREHGDLLDRPIFDVVHPEEHEATRLAAQSLLDGREETHHVERRYLKQDGSVVWVAVSVSVERFGDGRPRYLIKQIEDITDRKEGERQIAALNAELSKRVNEAEVATRAKSAFLANMSHEIRTPMNAIIGLGYLAEREAENPRQRDLMRKISGAAHHLLDIINDVLDISKIEAGKLTLEQVDMEMGDLLDEVCSLVLDRAREKNLDLVVDVSPGLDRMLRGDPTRVKQALLNYASNAIKFTERGTLLMSVRIVAETATAVTVRFEVRDSGIGIEAGSRERLFSAFEQSDSSTTRKYGGTGLGLAINRRLAELMGGEVGVESEPGVGSTFWLTAVLGKSDRRSKRTSMARLAGIRTLVVDGLPDSRSAIGAMLQRLDVEAETSDSAEEALDRIAAADRTGDGYGLVIVDRSLPGLDGLEFAKRVASLGLQHVPGYLLLASYDYPAVCERAIAAGFHAALRKPITPSSLHDTLARLLPSEAPAPEVETAATEHELASKHRGARVLVAEDNRINQEVALDLLRGVGLQVDVAVDGRQAVEMARDTAYDLILMDMQMPELDGLDATRAIRAMPARANTPIIAMTANAFGDDKARCLEAGMNAHVGKPVQPDMLFATLLHWLPLPRSEAKQAPDKVADGDLRRRLDAIDAIDCDAGLRNLSGRIERYAPLLRQFAGDHFDDAARLRDHWIAGRSREALRIAHTLKGVAATLSVRHIPVLAARIESAARTSDGSEVLVLVDALEAMLTEACTALLAAIPAENTHPAPVPAPQKLDMLQALLVAGSYRAAEMARRLTPGLSPVLGERMREFEKQIAGFDFPRAAELLAHCRQTGRSGS